MIADAPALPPYGIMTESALQCAVAASRKWEVPELLLHSIIAKEGGRPGLWSKNSNGTYDLGPAQINTSAWRDFLAPYGITARHVADDVCTNIKAAAYILKTYQLRMGGDWFKAVMAYHIGPNRWSERPEAVGRGTRYASHVYDIWRYLYGYAKSHAVRYTKNKTTGDTP